MTNQNLNSQQANEENMAWQPLVYFAGAVIGLITGIATAHLYRQAVENNPANKNEKGIVPSSIEISDMLKIALAALAVIRQISDLGARKPKSK